MNSVIKMKKKEENDNVLAFEKVEPRTAHSDGDGGDWLTPMLPNTVFVARDKKYQGYEVGQFTILGHNTKTTNLWVSYAQYEVAITVDPARFCRDIEFLEIVHEPNEEETGEENGQGDRTD